LGLELPHFILGPRLRRLGDGWVWNCRILSSKKAVAASVGHEVQVARCDVSGGSPPSGRAAHEQLHLLLRSIRLESHCKRFR